MDVGLLALGDWLADPVTGRCPTHGERHRQFVEQAVRAECAGFHSVHLGEHHFSDYILSRPPVVLAAIAERTSTIRLSNGVALAANLDPVRVAAASFSFADFATMTSTVAICGSPDEVVDRMGQASETLHLDLQLVMLDMGGIGDSELFDAIDLVGSDVIPRVSNRIAPGV